MKKKTIPPLYINKSLLTIRTKSPDSENKDICSNIIPGLWIGTIEHSQDEELLRRLKIDAILSLGVTTIEYPFIDDYLYVDIEDHGDAPIAAWFQLTSDWIKNKLDKKQNVLVHCYAGIRRSPTIVMAHIMNVAETPNFTEAYDIMSKKRKCFNPHLGFILELQKYEEKLKNRNNNIVSCCSCGKNIIGSIQDHFEEVHSQVLGK